MIDSILIIRGKNEVKKSDGFVLNDISKSTACECPANPIG